MITAEVNGWPELRARVFTRDGGCIAHRMDIFGIEVITLDDCRDGYGNVIRWTDLGAMEWEHVKEQLGMQDKAPDDEAHGVTVCPWHHRLSSRWRVDSKVNREKVRDHLRKLYPEVWGAAA